MASNMGNVVITLKTDDAVAALQMILHIANNYGADQRAAVVIADIAEKALAKVQTKPVEGCSPLTAGAKWIETGKAIDRARMEQFAKSAKSPTDNDTPAADTPTIARGREFI